MFVVVTFALDSEFSLWQRIRPFRRVPGSVSSFEARIAGARLRVLLTGVGSTYVRRALGEAFKDRPAVCISAGFAGGLRAEHRPGAVLVARSVALSGGESPLDSHQNLIEAACAHGAKVVDRFLTAPAMMLTPAEKQRLSHLADAVDMESHAVLSEAAAWHIPAVAVRAISDPAEHSLPLDFSRTLGSTGQIRLSLVLRRLALAPHRLPALVRLGRHSRRAAAKLAQFLDSYVPAVAALALDSALPQSVEVA